MTQRRKGAEKILFWFSLCLCASASDFERLAARATEARAANHLEQAVSLYREALSLRPGWAEGWWYLGTLLYDRDDYAAAAGALERAVKLNPQSAAAVAMLGLSEAKLGRDREALAHIEAGRTLGAASDPDLRRVMLFTKGTLLLKAGKFGEAQDTLDTLVRDGAEQEELIVALGSAVLGLPSVDSAAREIVRRAGWAEHFAARREIGDAAREYGSLAADYPKFHNVQFAYGRFLVATHQDEQAVEAFKREIENTPNHLLARLGIAGIRLVSDPAAGLPYAEQAVKLAPKLPEAHYLLGALLLNTGKTERAIRELETAQRAEPGEAKVYFALARAYTAANRKEDAARARAAFNRLNTEGK